MDPLGARPVVVDGASLPRWGSEQCEDDPSTSDSMIQNAYASNDAVSPFPLRDDLNRKIILW